MIDKEHAVSLDIEALKQEMMALLTRIYPDKEYYEFAHIVSNLTIDKLATSGRLAQGWRDISTAPRDGMKVLLGGYVSTLPDFQYGIGHWIEKAQIWSHFVGGKPTSWKPLDLPPAPGKDGAG